MTQRSLVFAVVAWLVLSASLLASGAEPAVMVLGGITAVFVATAAVAMRLFGACGRSVWARSTAPRSAPPRTDPRTVTLRNDARSTASSDSDRLHAVLLALLDDRLLAHHQVDRARSPETARQLLGPSLTRLVDGPNPKTATPRELKRTLSEIEAL
ncbi:MAG: hypothetical protein GY708_13840 [Actinomycetia bacterium]|nr:hypothetical protein [Actinomycetes bacterium]